MLPWCSSLFPFLHTHAYLVHFYISWDTNKSSFNTLFQEPLTVPKTTSFT